MTLMFDMQRLIQNAAFLQAFILSRYETSSYFTVVIAQVKVGICFDV